MEEPILSGIRGCDRTRFDPRTHLTAHRCNISQLHINNSEETAAHSELTLVLELQICWRFFGGSNRSYFLLIQEMLLFKTRYAS